MGNRITNHNVNTESVKLSNGATSVLMSVLALSASDKAATDWEKQFASWIALRDQSVLGLGIVGFDISDFGWSTKEFDTQKAFVLSAIDLALQHHRWEVLSYKPAEFMDDVIRQFRELIAAFGAQHIVPERDGQWKFDDFISSEMCPVHGVYKHLGGCLLCNDG